MKPSPGAYGPVRFWEAPLVLYGRGPGSAGPSWDRAGGGGGWGWGHEDQEAVIVQEGTRLHGRSNLQLGDEGPLGRRYNRAGRLGG